ncbi:MAG: ABC transporter ATP-binding protein [Kouleothrix sp.]|nr:ABC transporter ATP-binding protein [Kouleothrix sp.]
MNLSLRQYWDLLVTYLAPQRPRVLALSALLLGSIALQVANPQILRYFIDTAQAGGERQALLSAALLFIGVALLTQALSVAATYVSENVGWTATNLLRADLALHCLRLDMAFHKARTPGELIERIDGDVTALANFFSQFVIKVFGNLLLLVGVLAMLYREDARVGLAMTAFALVVLLALVKAQSIAVPHWKAARQTSAELFGFIEERLAGAEDLRSSGAVGFTMHQLSARSRERLLKERKASVIGALTWVTPVALFAIGVAVAFVMTKSLFDARAITLGSAYLIFFYTQTLVHPIHMITRQLEDLQKASAGAARIRDLYATTSAIEDGSQPLPPGPLAVAFEEVSFAYRDEAVSSQQPAVSSQHRINDELPAADCQLPAEDASVLSEISFAIAPGRVLGILGRTGSGKTTLTRLLFRLYDPSTGAIRLGGVDIRAARRAALRMRVGMVTQEVQLFHASVRDNLTFFDETIPDERVLRVLDELGLLPWLQSLPNGLDTLLAAGSGGLSAGEAQILAFTRVFLTNPGLVILDEASSRLDPATERLLERAVDRLLADRTGIIIAHRLATVLRADDILILEGGRIREYGPRETLMADPQSRFAELLRVGLEEVLA